MTEFDLLVDLHLHGKRQGPGDTEHTLRALDMISIAQQPGIRIADIGCGTGQQTLVLAQHTQARVVGVDLFPAFLDVLNANAQKLGLQDRVQTVEADMGQLPFAQEEYDILWAEGAIYNLGFEHGAQLWRQYIKPGGYLAVSEISWLTPTRPAEVEEYWLANYAEVDTMENKAAVLERNGYEVVGSFALPPQCWEEQYYQPLEQRLDAFAQRHAGLPLAQQIVQGERNEIAMYRKYKDYYSYGFYVARKK